MHFTFKNRCSKNDLIKETFKKGIMMKALLFVSVLMFAGFAQASESYTCGIGPFAKETQPKTLTMTLTALGKTVDQVNEGVSVPYSLVLKNGDQVWMSVKVRVITEDVMFGFKHRSRQSGNVEGMIYMDEPDQTHLSVNGTQFSFDCSVSN